MAEKARAGIEQRRHPRVSAPGTAALVRGSGERFDFPIRDVSRGGVFLFARSAPMELGEVATLTLTPIEPGPEVTVKAELVRTVLEPGEGLELLGMGLQFVQVDDTQSAALDAFLGRVFQGKGGERRAYPRISHRLDVWCGASRPLKAILRDISEGGVGLFVEGRVEVGEKLTVEVDAPGGLALKLKGIVRTSRPTGDGDSNHFAGVEFEGLDETGRGILRAFLGKLLRG